MGRWTDFSKKEHLGSIDWRVAQDWKILQWGSIFTISPDELKKYSWGDLGFGETIEFPIIKSEYDPSVKGQNSKYYYTVVLDWEYLLERQALLFASLGWGKDEIANFLSQQLEWLDRRSKDLEKTKQEHSILEAAENMSKLTGQSVEYWLEKIKETKEQPKEKTEVFEEFYEPMQEVQTLSPKSSKKDLSHLSKGTVVKLGNEYFVETEDGRWKVGTTEKYRTKIGNLDLEKCSGFEYHFEPDKETKAPKSRQAKGWVKELVWA